MKVIAINKIEIGELIQGFFLCTEKNIKSTRLGDLYIDLRLKDATGSIRGKVWTHVSYFSNQFNVNDIVAIKADVIEYNKTKDLNVKFVKKANSNFYSEHGYSQNLIFPAIKEPIEKLNTFIFSQIDTLPNMHKLMITKIYKHNIKLIQIVPINKVGYRLRGGLIKYIYSLLKLHVRTKGILETFDKYRIIICILIMHIGYIKYYENNDIFSISKEGLNLGTCVLGLNIVIPYLETLNKSENIYYQQCILSNLQSIIEKHIIYVRKLIALEDSSKN